MSELHQTAFKKAQVLYEIGRYEEVISLLGPHLSSLPDSYIFFHALYKTGQYDEILRLSQNISPNNDRYIDILRLRAWTFYDIDEFQQAKSEISEAIKLAPNDETVHYTYAWIKLTLREYKSAHSSILTAISLAPDNSCFYDALARICLARGQEKQAIIAFETAININPENDEALFGLSQLKTTRKAQLDLLRSALRIDPTDKCYQSKRKELINAYPWWLLPDKYSIQIALPIRIVLVVLCFTYAFLNPVLAQSITNINDPVYLHHVVYTVVFAIIINNIWLSEFILILCISLFSRELFISPTSDQMVIFTLQVLSSVIALPFVKPVIFYQLEYLQNTWRNIRALPTVTTTFKALCVLPLWQLDKVLLPWLAAIAFMFGMQGNHVLLWLCVGPSILFLCMLAFCLCVVVPILVLTFDLNGLRRVFLQLSILFFPWLSIHVFFYLQLIFFSLILNLSVFSVIETQVAIVFGYVISSSTIRFHNLVADTRPGTLI